MKIKVKKLMIFILTALFMTMTAACGETNNDTSAQKSTASTSTSSNNENTSVDKNTANTKNNKVLIVYFSHTGNTKKLAVKIKGYTNADIAEIKPVTAYPNDYNTLLDQAKKEQSEDYMPKITANINELESYDLILIGSPLWWSQMAPPVKTFLSQHNLSGKKVALFITHGGSGLADSENNLKKLCPNSTIQKSLAVNGKKVSDSDNEVKEWLNELQ